jgi:hypothetical protein
MSVVVLRPERNQIKMRHTGGGPKGFASNKKGL